jgi:hypothetical protein
MQEPKLACGAQVTDRQQVPADLALLSAANAEGVAYVENMNLDGETNLKLRKAPRATWPLADEARARRRPQPVAVPGLNLLLRCSCAVVDALSLHPACRGAERAVLRVIVGARGAGRRRWGRPGCRWSASCPTARCTRSPGTSCWAGRRCP